MSACLLLILCLLLFLYNIQATRTVNYPVSDGSGFRTCIQRTDNDPCPPDTEIGICPESGTKVSCQPCQPGLRQCDKTTSHLLAKCYDPANHCSTNGDNVVVVRELSPGCTITCRCNEAAGFTGLDPNQCDNNKTPCPTTHERAIVGGSCFPCREGYHNPWDDGLNECVKIDAGRPTEQPSASKNVAGEMPSTTTSSILPTSTSRSTSRKMDSTQPATTDRPSDSDSNNKMNKMEHKSKYPLWAVILAIIMGIGFTIIVTLLLYYLFCRRKAVPIIEDGQSPMVTNRGVQAIPNGPVATEHDELETCPLMDRDPGRRNSLDRAGNIDAVEDELYTSVKEEFISIVDPKHLLLFLKLPLLVDEKIFEMEKQHGRLEAARYLLKTLIQHYKDWPSEICNVLRKDDVGMPFLADYIVEKQQSLYSARQAKLTGRQSM